ncbi:peptide-methionine (S)-S-oxide reductase MsrA [Paramixta manurensis]|uniref:Peptide methionine sulfoxide reductase MsrA n=1 Tax=Paramixta manurensis TaxID=2740817 RepID=A0A6M8UB16_9GAMM|nr:peptide-methionine (S)-S-oxide reductase MsrA [Erwiniaceae bacterium PD-1]
MKRQPTHFRRTLCAVAIAAGALMWQNVAWSWGGAEQAVTIAPPVRDEAPATSHSETAIFAGGCFWGVQGVFQHVKGVTSAVSGYTGGSAQTANYDTVSTGSTGHAESVKVTFDPTQVSYGTLLQIFFSVAHNPTELNRQGPDSGTQYRSAIFPQTPEQQQVAQAYIKQLNASHAWRAPLVTRIENNAHFYPAEGYHQNYLTENPEAPYIVINDMPKLTQLKQLFPTRYNTQPVLVKDTKSL